MRPVPDDRVAAWLDRQDERSLFTTTVSQAEILTGIALLADGRRRRNLEAAASAVFLEDLGGRVLPFDAAAAAQYALVFAQRRQAGRVIGMADAMIAAIARAHGADLVTRNTRDFEGLRSPAGRPVAGPGSVTPGATGPRDPQVTRPDRTVRLPSV
jgi:toxin FitB